MVLALRPKQAGKKGLSSSEDVLQDSEQSLDHFLDGAMQLAEARTSFVP